MHCQRVPSEIGAATTCDGPLTPLGANPLAKKVSCHSQGPATTERKQRSKSCGEKLLGFGLKSLTV